MPTNQTNRTTEMPELRIYTTPIKSEKHPELRGKANVVIGQQIAVNDILIREDQDQKLHLQMPSVPSNREESGYKSICYPTNKEFSNYLYNSVIYTYLSADYMVRASRVVPGAKSRYEVTCGVVEGKEKLLGMASLKLDDSFKIDNIAIMHGSKGDFVRWPNRSYEAVNKESGETEMRYANVVEPVKASAGQINGVIMKTYQQKLEQTKNVDANKEFAAMKERSMKSTEPAKEESADMEQDAEPPHLKQDSTVESAIATEFEKENTEPLQYTDRSEIGDRYFLSERDNPTMKDELSQEVPDHGAKQPEMEQTEEQSVTR